MLRFASACFALACITAVAAEAAEPAEARLVNPKGADVGEARVEAVPSGVLLHVKVQDLPPGPHGMHLHAVGACTPDFKAAAGHVNIHTAEHGLRNPKGPEAGDLPNLYVGADGRGEAEVHSTLTTPDALLDADASALVIHANPDDHMSQPIGGSGDRIACGVLKRG
ncbi:MAG TPA: superoxide dismutase family protein [Rhodospirillales bacterium]|nr:superoxide dismutase family protein [Rhodospirillales bacterium]